MTSHLVTITKHSWPTKLIPRSEYVGDYELQARDFTTATMSHALLADCVGNHGHAFYGAFFGRPVAKQLGKTKNWCYTSLIAFDFDNKPGQTNISIDEAIQSAKEAQLDLKFAYTTLSHTKAQPRFRLVCDTKKYNMPLQANTKVWLAKLKAINTLVFNGAADKHALSPIKLWQGSINGLYYVENK